MKSRITPFFIFILFINIFSFQGHAQKSIQQDIDKIKQFIPQKLDSALILSKGLLKYTSKKSDSLLAISHYFQGIIYYYKGHYYISSEYYLRALKSAFVENNKKFKGKIHNNLGVNYDMTDQYEMALTEYKKSMEIDQEFNDFEGIAQSNLNIGLLYFNLKQYDNGLK